MERKFTFSTGEYYHLYNRGVNKSRIFFDAYDYQRFVLLLYLCNSDVPVRVGNLLQNKQGLPLLEIKKLVFEIDRGNCLVDIGAYCLMPNHFHLLVHEKNDGGISKFMLKLSTAYSMYANERHDRTGAFFEGPFRATHVLDDTYLKYLFAYIHLNPIKLKDKKWKENGIKDKKGAEKFLHEYAYSSYIQYIEHTSGEDRESKILNRVVFPQYFSKNASFTKYIKDWLYLEKGQSFKQG